MAKRITQSVANCRIFALACVFSFAGQGMSYGQESATITGDHAEATAGESFTLHLTFDAAATCDHNIQLRLANLVNNQSIVLDGTLAAGKNSADVRTVLSKDLSGEFVSNTAMYGKPNLLPCAGYSAYKTISAPTITLDVKAIPDPNSYPASASVELTLTQKQFLGTKIAQLNALSSAIDTRVDANGRDSIELRTFLAGIVETAQADLTKTEHDYRTQLLKHNEPIPAFFSDFRKQYEDIHTELKAPVPGTRASFTGSAHLLYVQQPLKRRPDSPLRSGNRSGTSPMVAKGVKSTVEDNASAYKIIQTTGRAMFHAQFESIPSGATLFYRQAIETDFSIWSKPTNISGADFTLARFVFKFHRDDCDDEPVAIVDPYDNTNPDVSVEFKKCRKR